MKKLHISRDIQMNRVHRLNYGPDFRGHKPIQVCLLNYRDKEEILRKARLLKGSNIYISEDFSRKVREHRNELIKFMKEVKSRDPTRQEQINYRTGADNRGFPLGFSTTKGQMSLHCPGTKEHLGELKILSRDKGTVGQGFSFFPGTKGLDWLSSQK